MLGLGLSGACFHLTAFFTEMSQTNIVDAEQTPCLYNTPKRISGLKRVKCNNHRTRNGLLKHTNLKLIALQIQLRKVTISCIYNDAFSAQGKIHLTLLTCYTLI